MIITPPWMESPYLAEFDTPAGNLWVAALRWPLAGGALLPREWWQVLRVAAGIDITLRVRPIPDPVATMLLTSDRRDSVIQLLAALDSQGGVTPAVRAMDTADFDVFVELRLHTFHLRVLHDGYHRDGLHLACDFNLFSNWIGQAHTDEVQYQICLRAHSVDREQERRVRKYLAWLDLEQPFTEPVRDLQKVLSQRLLEPTWLTDEYLLFKDRQQRAFWQARMSEHFSATTGRIGFEEPPLEAGEYTDYLTIGYHTARDRDGFAAVPCEAASTISNEEVLWLLRQTFAKDSGQRQEAAPEIFISYASSDFAQADAVRHFLESRDHRCWIAPRDINTSARPYTEAIPLAVKNAKIVVVLVSAAANLSEHIPRELDLAVEQKLPIIPIRLADLLPAGQLEYLLRTCQWLDLFARDRESALAELEARIYSLQK